MKNLQKGFIVPVLLAIIALLVIGGGVYIYNNKKVEAPNVVDTGTQQTNQVQQQTNNQTTPVNTQTNNPASQTTSTSNWKTYTNNSLKYSVKYPPNWYLYSSTDESATIQNWQVDSPLSLNGQKSQSLENISIDIVSYINATNPVYINVKDEALVDWTKDMTDKQNILVGGAKAVRGYALRDGQKVGAVRFVFNGELYFISYDPYNSKLVSMFDKILSTFKFTTPKIENPTVSWKTYTNTQYGFSVQYPTTTKIKDTSVGVILTDGEKEFIVNVAKGLPVDEFPCGFESGSLAKGNISLDGTIFTSFDSSKQTQAYGGGNVGVTQYCAFHKGDKYELFTQIHYPSNAEYVKDSSLVNKDILLNQILSTFKFTK